MTDVEQHKNREFFISVAHEYIKRPGVSELLAYLNQKTDLQIGVKALCVLGSKSGK